MLLCFAETARTGGVDGKGFPQLGYAKVGPRHRGKVKFAVGALIEQIVAQALFAAGADKKIRIRLSGRIQPQGERLLRHILRSGAVAQQIPHGPDDFGAAAVVEREIERHGPVGGGTAHAVPQGRTGGERQPIDVSEHIQADALAFHTGNLLTEKLQQKGEQGCHFRLGAVPVLAGKRVERQIADAHFTAFGHDVARGFRAGAMPGLTRQAARLGPAAVAVHDDGEMDGQRLRRDGVGSVHTAPCACGARPV